MKQSNHKIGMRGIFLMLCAMQASLAGLAAAQAFGTTTVQGTVYLANGTPASGTLQLSWPAFATAAAAVESRADELGVAEDALWAVGDAAGTLDLLRDAALDEVEDGSRPAAVLRGQIVFGASFVEDPELPDRGTTLLFGWPEPLAPASWPWSGRSSCRTPAR